MTGWCSRRIAPLPIILPFRPSSLCAFVCLCVPLCAFPCVLPGGVRVSVPARVACAAVCQATLCAHTLSFSHTLSLSLTHSITVTFTRTHVDKLTSSHARMLPLRHTRKGCVDCSPGVCVCVCATCGTCGEKIWGMGPLCYCGASTACVIVALVQLAAWRACCLLCSVLHLAPSSLLYPAGPWRHKN